MDEDRNPSDRADGQVNRLQPNTTEERASTSGDQPPSASTASTHKEGRDWYDRTTLCILSVTFLAALAAAGFTGWLGWRTADLANDGHKQLIAATRAWIGPNRVSIEGFGAQSKATNIVLDYKNTGKEPALNFNDSYNDDWTGTLINGDQLDLTNNCLADGPNGQPSQETCKSRITRWLENNCRNKAPYENKVVYPDFPNSVTKSFTITPERIGKKKVGFLQGCFIYRSRVTSEIEHRSAFCFFDLLVPDRSAHTMRSCPEGNDAD
jgi:hypothetical protein